MKIETLQKTKEMLIEEGRKLHEIKDTLIKIKQNEIRDFLKSISIEDVEITLDTSALKISTPAAKGYQPHEISIFGLETRWEDDTINPELSWFSSRTDAEDESNYLTYLSVLGKVAAHFKEVSGLAVEKRNELNDILSKIRKLNSEIRDVDREIEKVSKEAKEKMFFDGFKEGAVLKRKMKIEVPYPANIRRNIDQYIIKKINNKTAKVIESKIDSNLQNNKRIKIDELRSTFISDYNSKIYTWEWVKAEEEKKNENK